MPNLDLDVVLSVLARPPFKLLGFVSLKHLSMKVAFLLALTSTKTVSELHALSVSAECFRVGAGSSGLTTLYYITTRSCLTDVNRHLHLSAGFFPKCAETSEDTRHLQLKSDVYIHLSQIHLNSVLILVKIPCFRSVRITILFKNVEMSE